jgi:hypothetical protein
MVALFGFMAAGLDVTLLCLESTQCRAHDWNLSSVINNCNHKDGRVR